jgi:hypothetical protein
MIASVPVAGSVDVAVDTVFLAFIFALDLGLGLGVFIDDAVVILLACDTEAGWEGTSAGWLALPCFDSQHF